MTGASAPDISVIIATWNTRELLARCLDAIAAHEPAQGALEVVVVDNGSLDGTAAMVRERYRGVVLIENARNLGYTSANNQGIAMARGRYLLLLNSDAFVTAGACDRMLAFAEADPRIGAVGPRLVYGDGRWQRWTAGRAPTLRTALNHYLFLDRLAPRITGCGGLYLGDDTTRARRVDWVSSACMLVRADAVRAVGNLDERIFTYMDDVDLCERLRAAGWSVWYCPDAQVVHLMGGSSTGGVGAAAPAALRSFNAYFARRHGRLASIGLRAVQLVGLAARVVLYEAASALRREPELGRRARSHLRSLGVVLGGRGMGGVA